MKLQLISNEGPIALILCASRDAASTTYSVVSVRLFEIDLYAA